jgi:hypothetical protein
MWWLRLAIFLLTVAISSTALATERIGLINPTPPFREALAATLSAWDVQLVDVTADLPAVTMPRAATDARALAGKENVVAIVWIADADGKSLWLYDTRTEQIASRSVLGSLDDEADLAALALTVKTLLRSTTLAPVSEQLGATSPPPPPVVLPAEFRLELDGGIRVNAPNASRIGPRVGLGFAWWPRALKQRLGLALRVEEGLGFSVAQSEFHGRLGDHAASAAVRSALPLFGRFALEPAFGATAHLTTLDGAPIDERTASDVSRVDPSLDLSLALKAMLGRDFDVGLRATGSLWTRWQRYGLDEGKSFEMPPLQATIALFVGAGLR